MSKKHILIIDDEEDIGELLTLVLEGHDFKTSFVNNINDAFETIKNKKFDLIVSDVRMPCGGASRLLQMLDEAKILQQQTIILISGYSDITNEDIEKFGVLKYINKPFDVNKFVEDVKDVLERA
jgi:two-component system response regulator PilR (NtrC family)